MEAKPVTQKQAPAYPTRRDVLKGMASFVLVGLAGTRVIGDDGNAKGITVAPVFEHGDGRGVAGCVVVSPPVFLSEEEAMQIIQEELTKHDIKLKKGSVLKGIRVPWITIEEMGLGKLDKERYEQIREDLSRRAKPFELDGLDRSKRIAVEFVSEKDYFNFGGSAGPSTVRNYDFRKVAHEVARGVKKHATDDVIFAVFYDPAFQVSPQDLAKDGEEVDLLSQWREAWKRNSEKSKSLLRQQARDFVAWLKKQKALS